MTKIGLVLMALAMSAAILWSNAALSGDTLDRAISLAAEERYREARLTLDPLLEREPASSHARLLHGILRLHEGDRDEAIDTFRSLMRDFPDLFEAYNNLAVVYVQEGRLEDARGVLLGILERQPESIGYRNLGDIYVKLARGAYARARELGFDTTAVRERSQPVRPPPPRTSDPAASAAARDGSVRCTDQRPVGTQPDREPVCRLGRRRCRLCVGGRVRGSRRRRGRKAMAALARGRDSRDSSGIA